MLPIVIPFQQREQLVKVVMFGTVKLPQRPACKGPIGSLQFSVVLELEFMVMLQRAAWTDPAGLLQFSVVFSSIVGKVVGILAQRIFCVSPFGLVQFNVVFELDGKEVGGSVTLVLLLDSGSSVYEPLSTIRE